MSIYKQYEATTLDSTINAFFTYYLFGIDYEQIQKATPTQFLKAQSDRSKKLDLDWDKKAEAAFNDAIAINPPGKSGEYTREQLAAAWGPWNVVKVSKKIKPLSPKKAEVKEAA